MTFEQLQLLKVLTGILYARSLSYDYCNELDELEELELEIEIDFNELDNVSIDELVTLVKKLGGKQNVK